MITYIFIHGLNYNNRLYLRIKNKSKNDLIHKIIDRIIKFRTSKRLILRDSFFYLSLIWGFDPVQICQPHSTLIDSKYKKIKVTKF